LNVTLPAASSFRIFAPNEVKIAFDLVREIFFNALKNGAGPDVQLRMTAVEIENQTGFAFSNRAEQNGIEPGVNSIDGSCHRGKNPAVLGEVKSGLLKIAS